jgi:hypothetical protein
MFRQAANNASGLLSSNFALFGVRRFIAALVFFDLEPIIRYPM